MSSELLFCAVGAIIALGMYAWFLLSWRAEEQRHASHIATIMRAKLPSSAVSDFPILRIQARQAAQ